MKIKSAIFDMDGTLVDSLMCWDILWKEFGNKYLGGNEFFPLAEDDKAVRTLPLKDAMNLIHSHYQIGADGEDLLATANQVMLDFYSNSLELKEGVREFLDFCFDKGIKMCIASATAPDLIDVAIKHCGIEKYFLKIFSCGVLGKGKEEPDIFLQAQEFFGTETEETWVFEDSLVALGTAAKIGMPTVGIYDRFNPPQDEIKKIVTEYIASGEKLTRLISKIES